MALPTPTRTTMMTSTTCDGDGDLTTQARASEKMSCSIDKTIRNLLRSTLSAMSPPTMASRSAGPSWAKMITPTKVLDRVMS